MTLSLHILNKTHAVITECSAEGEVALVYDAAYAEGDMIGVTAPADTYLWVWLACGLPPALVYAQGGMFCLPVPFGATAQTYSPRAFTGEMHRLQARIARPEEVTARRDLALNPYDHHANKTLFPHVSANAETRGEAVFAARNAIDGEVANDSHGFWPYTSWGIAKNPEAALTLDFGRRVTIDEVALTIRADFPHDAWWTGAKITFDGAETQTVELRKTGQRQGFAIAPRQVSTLTLHSLIKADDPSPYPALTRIEAMGWDTPDR
ncbi:discoidin domain-containing protein [Rhodobacteraceae bacterium]|nr:discoidin domain-containing protein [Paracoccaceae bacterium]